MEACFLRLSEKKFEIRLANGLLFRFDLDDKVVLASV